MTNQEIIIEIPLPCELNTADLNRVMNEARADELQEIEQRLQSLIPLPNNEFGQKLGTIMLVIANKLSSLRKEGIV